LNPNSDINHVSDENLLKSIGDGNKRAISELYRRYSPKIFRRSISLVKDQATAEDLTHDIFWVE